MEQFSSLEGKVRELETPTSTLLYQYDSVAKTAIDSEKHNADGREGDDANSRRAFLEKKRSDRVVIARISLDNPVRYGYRPKYRDVFSKVRVCRRKLFSSAKNRYVLGLKYPRIDRAWYLYLILYISTCGQILRFVNLGQSKQDWYFWTD